MTSLSTEQTRIVSAVHKGNNVIVDAVAGAGKTTTILEMVKACPDRTFLVVTYSARLKTEARERVVQKALKNVEVHSYHSMVHQIAPPCRNDAQMQAFLHSRKGVATPLPMPTFDVLVLDEAQDMTPLFFDLVCALCDQIQKPQVVVLGDKYQSVFGFMKSDPRYLTCAKDTLSGVVADRPWEALTLSTSFRCAESIARFLNECMLGYTRMHTPDGAQAGSVEYLQLHPYTEMPHRVATIIQDELRGGCSYNDIMILLPSLPKKDHPASWLANKLSYTNLPVYMRNDNGEPDSRSMQNKVRFLTFHQCKGLEARVVIVLNFDEGYMDYFASGEDKRVCPDTLYWISLTFDYI